MSLRPKQNVCIFCGSLSGNKMEYARVSQTLGKSIADEGLGLVYGGGQVGLMGEIAQSVLDNGGYVTGIIPAFLRNKEVALENVQDLIVTNNMHERKYHMCEKSDAFIALPGGIGTLEELVEQLTWVQLQRHSKPIVLANLNNFWHPFLDLLNHMRDEGFIRDGLYEAFEICDEVEHIVPKIKSLIANNVNYETQD